MNGSRYYPSQVALPAITALNLAAGDPVVIGGTIVKACAVEDPNSALWPQTLSFNGRNLDAFYLRGWEAPHSSTAAWVQLGVPAGAAPEIGWPNWPNGPTPNTPYFRWFPQTFLLAGTPIKIFIAGDTHIDFVGPSMPPNPTNPAPSFAHWQVYNRLLTSYKLDVAGTAPTSVATSQDRFYGSAVIMHTLTPVARTNRILRFGGATGDHGQSVALSTVEEWNDATSSWVAKAPLTHARVYQNAVILPTGEIFIVGGSDTDPANNPSTGASPRLEGEIYNPGTGPTAGSGSTSVVASLARPRVYHSVAALLRDGRVASLGGQDVLGFGVSGHSVEIYSPPYLHLGPRAVINSVTPASAVAYNSGVVVNMTLGTESGEGGGGGEPPADFDTLKVVLIRPASVSHHFDFDQRYVELAWSTVVQTVGGWDVNVMTPLDATYAPPGYYMLFVIVGGIPSVAATLQLG